MTHFRGTSAFIQDGSLPGLARVPGPNRGLVQKLRDLEGTLVLQNFGRVHAPTQRRIKTNRAKSSNNPPENLCLAFLNQKEYLSRFRTGRPTPKCRRVAWVLTTQENFETLFTTPCLSAQHTSTCFVEVATWGKWSCIVHSSKKICSAKQNEIYRK